MHKNCLTCFKQFDGTDKIDTFVCRPLFTKFGYHFCIIYDKKLSHLYRAMQLMPTFFMISSNIINGPIRFSSECIFSEELCATEYKFVLFCKANSAEIQIKGLLFKPFDLDLHCLQVSLYGTLRINGLTLLPTVGLFDFRVMISHIPINKVSLKSL